MLTGISMGGMGSLRLGLKHPDVFGALAAMEPGIDAAIEFLHRHLNPPPPDPVARAGRRRYQRIKNRLGVKGHFDE